MGSSRRNLDFRGSRRALGVSHYTNGQIGRLISRQLDSMAREAEDPPVQRISSGSSNHSMPELFGVQNLGEFHRYFILIFC